MRQELVESKRVSEPLRLQDQGSKQGPAWQRWRQDLPEESQQQDQSEVA
jgi:hypothetical protein